MEQTNQEDIRIYTENTAMLRAILTLCLAGVGAVLACRATIGYIAEGVGSWPVFAGLCVVAIGFFFALGIIQLNCAKELLILSQDGIYYKSLFREIKLQWCNVADYGFYPILKLTNGEILEGIYFSKIKLTDGNPERAAKKAVIRFTASAFWSKYCFANHTAVLNYCRHHVS